MRTSNLPRLGFNLPARIFKAVDFPMPLVPTRPSTCPGRGVGNLQCEGCLSGGRRWAFGFDSMGYDHRFRHANRCARLCSLNALAPYRCVVSFAMFFGRLMIMMASNGHFCRHTSSPEQLLCRAQGGGSAVPQCSGALTFTQMPQPMHNSSEIQATLELGEASTQSLPA